MPVLLARPAEGAIARSSGKCSELESLGRRTFPIVDLVVRLRHGWAKAAGCGVVEATGVTAADMSLKLLCPALLIVATSKTYDVPLVSMGTRTLVSQNR